MYSGNNRNNNNAMVVQERSLSEHQALAIRFVISGEIFVEIRWPFPLANGFVNVFSVDNDSLEMSMIMVLMRLLFERRL